MTIIDRSLKKPQMSKKKMKQKKITFENWLLFTRREHPRQTGLTDWLSGNQSPVHAGWYERSFTDSLIFHYWDGEKWLTRDGKPHWRQVGDYPAWRGLTQQFNIGDEIQLFRGGANKIGIGCKREIRAKLNYIDTNHMISCTLLEDDPLASMSPFKSGETGLWNGLSFITKD